MADSPVDVVLVSLDDRLRERVRRQAPPNARLLTLTPLELRALEPPPSAASFWLDLDARPVVPAAAMRRVYFHSGKPAGGAELPPGLYIRKPFSRRVLDVLWAGAADAGPRASPGASDSPASGLPAWILDFHVLGLKDLCRRLVHELRGRLRYAHATLYLHDAAQAILTLAETTHRHAVELTIAMNDGEHAIAAAARAGRLILAPASAGTRWASSRAGGAAEATDAAQPQLIAPLFNDQRLEGVLHLSRRVTDAGQIPMETLETVFRFLSRCVHFARAHESVRLEARIDDLTHLYNQRWMHETLEAEIERARRFSAALSVLTIDLDGLKSINDREGHAAGDCVLRHVAGRIRAALRQIDGAARVGGDEFVVVLPGTDADGAQEVARRILRSVRSDIAHHRGTPLPITASVGVARWQPGWNAGRLLESADRSMYRAKQSGRDQFHAARAGDENRHDPGVAAAQDR